MTGVCLPHVILVISGNLKFVDVKALKEHAGSIGSYSPTAFKLADCPTPQSDGSIEKVKVPLVLRTMNTKVPKDANKADVDDNTI